MKRRGRWRQPSLEAAMQSPTQLAVQLARHWQRADWREKHLLQAASAWPLRLPIAAPTATQFRDDSAAVAQHLQAGARDQRAVGAVGTATAARREGASHRSSGKANESSSRKAHVRSSPP